MIKVRLAVFVAAAIVFAPGAGPGDGSTQSLPSEWAARMLAPTFDEPQVAGYQPTALASKAQDHERRPLKSLFSLAAFFGVGSLASSGFAGLSTDRTKLRLRLLVSSLRDRGPPHLQLV